MSIVTLQILSLSGESGQSRTQQIGRCDPKRHFAAFICRIAKTFVDADVIVDPLSRSGFCSLAPLANFNRWRDKSTAGPSH
jgi:hypothetical protein